MHDMTYSFGTVVVKAQAPTNLLLSINRVPTLPAILSFTQADLFHQCTSVSVYHRAYVLLSISTVIKSVWTNFIVIVFNIFYFLCIEADGTFLS